VHASRVALIALVAANLVPLIGVAVLDWRLYDVMLIYWLENGLIGAFTVLRMASATEERASSIALPIVGTVPVAEGAALAAVGLVLSHGTSFARNWLAAGERDGRSPSSLMRDPYGRVAVLHVTLLVAGFAVMALGAPIAALAFMVVLKIVLDAAAHLREHRRARA